MGRSVSYPHTAQVVTFTHVEADEENWSDDLENLKSALTARFKSLYEDEKWIGREDHALLANNHCRVGVSEYCGLVAVWIVPRDSDYPELAAQWIASIEKSFDKVVSETFGGLLRHVATASNGEAFYQQA